LLKGYLVNTGKIDIKRDMVNSPIMLCLPEGYRWLEVKLVSSSSGVFTDIHILPDNNRNIEFKFELFKREEFVQFEALAEVPESNSKKPSSLIEEAIGFSLRISDTGKVEHLNLDYNYTERHKNVKRFIFTYIIGSIIFSILGIYLLNTIHPIKLFMNFQRVMER